MNNTRTSIPHSATALTRTKHAPAVAIIANGDGIRHSGGKRSKRALLPMDGPAPAKRGVEMGDYLAAGRTLLAWIRTSIALMGFGFVVARFGLFLQRLQFLEHVPTAPSHGISRWFGAALIVAGIVTIVVATQSCLPGPRIGPGHTGAISPMGPNRCHCLVCSVGWAGTGNLCRNPGSRNISFGDKRGDRHGINF